MQCGTTCPFNTAPLTSDAGLISIALHSSVSVCNLVGSETHTHLALCCLGGVKQKEA